MTALVTLINDGSEQLRADFLRSHEARLALPSLVISRFEKNTVSSRLEAVLLVLQECAHGADTQAAIPLASDLLSYFEHHARELPSNPQVVSHAYATAISCAVYADFQEGHWDHALELAKQPACDYPSLLQQPIYWNAIGTQARMLVRRNAVMEAETALSAAPRELFQRDNQLQTAARELNSFKQRRFDVDLRPTVSEQTSAIWRRDIPELRTSMMQLREHDIARARSANVAPLTEFIDGVIVRLGEAERMIDADLPFERKRVALAGALYDFQEAMRRYQSPRGDLDRVTFDWVSRCLHRVGALYSEERLSQAAADLLKDLDVAASWTRLAGDAHGSWLVEWSKLLILDDASRHSQAAQLPRRLLETLRIAQANTAILETKSDIANFFPDLPRRVLRLGPYVGRKADVIDATELRRARSLLAAAADPTGAVRMSDAGPAALGACVHYIGFTSLHHSREIHAVMYCADGMTSHESIGLSLDEVYDQVQLLDPAQWLRPSLFRKHTNTAADALSALLAPLSKALDEGRVREGDHVCIAAEDPLHLVPFQYLRLQGLPAVNRVSMSRAVSFADALRIAAAPPSRPRSAAALFIPPADEKDPRAKYTAFTRAEQALRACVETRELAQHSMTRETVFDALHSFELIHIDAHGFFDVAQNPWDSSGLLVSDGNGPPVRDGLTQRLLTPHQVQDGALRLAGRDVCLNACVSGLGLPGMGGDMLGLEFALRQSGAGCVVASHWNVEWALTARFFAEYYGRWLGEGLPRGRAWRQSILALAQQHAAQVPPETWCAMSLFGDWR